MPQMKLYARSQPTRLVLTYEVDPRDPLGNVTVSAIVYGAKQDALSRHSARVGGPHLDEWVSDLLQAAWLTYLYGEPDTIQQVWGPISRQWRRFQVASDAPS